MTDQVCNAVVSVLSSLSTMIDQERRLLGGVEGELQRIQFELSQMKALLETVDLIQHDDPQFKEWIKQVRKVSFEIEDAIDEYAILFAHPPSGGLFGHIHSTLNSIKTGRARHRLAVRLQSINATLRTISEARSRYETKYATAAPPKDSWRYNKDDEALYAQDVQLVGIERPKRELISKLLNGDSQFQVIAVQGMGGLGKTTLVKKVYDDAAVKSHFTMRAWVTVSQTYAVEKIFTSIIRELRPDDSILSPPGSDGVGGTQLKQHIRGILSEGRYVVVFDDVWDEGFWDEIKFALPENTYGGNRVLLTTRSYGVASASCAEFNIFQMQLLNSEESWTLFCRKVFKDNSCPAHLKDVAEKIVAKCEGLPLAIVTFGGIFASKDLSGADHWEVALRWVGDDLPGSNYLLDRANKILRLSFDDLPSYLKSCLLYLSIYPEDEVIYSIDLTPLWIGERFVEQRAGLDFEEVALKYLKDLANRSLIIVDDFGAEGVPETFHIHDLLRELLIREAREITLTTIVDDPQLRWPPGDAVRRLVFHGSGVLHEGSRSHFEKVRSIIAFDCTGPLPKAWFTQLSSSKFLKLLVLQSFPLEEIPKEIFNLILLTHLDLSYTNITEVPKTIKRLRNLEYLNLSETNVRKLPKEIRKLQKLRKIFVFPITKSSDIDAGLFGGFKALFNIGVLSELQVLYLIDVSESSKTRVISELGKLVQLRYLGVANLTTGDGKDLCASLEKLAKLRRLLIGSSTNQAYEEEEGIMLLDLNHPISPTSLQHVSTLVLAGRLEKMPPWTTNLQSLRQLFLDQSFLGDDPFETLQHLPNLVDIWLNRAYEGEIVCFRTGYFLKLKSLALWDMKGLRWMRVEEGAMPSIRELFLIDLGSFEELPFGIEHLRQLHELTVYGVGEKLMNEMSKEDFKTSEEYQRIAHIPVLRY